MLETTPTLDDTLDVFPCHGVGGMFGMICTAIFASKIVNHTGSGIILDIVLGGVGAFVGGIGGPDQTPVPADGLVAGFGKINGRPPSVPTEHRARRTWGCPEQFIAPRI